MKLKMPRPQWYKKKPEEKTTPSKRPHCPHCKYFRITWDKNYPYSCNAMGFKSKIMPSLEAFKNSGIQCQSYSPKPSKSQPKKQTRRHTLRPANVKKS